MVKTLTRHGNSLALVIDKPILDLLNIEADTPLELTTDGRVLCITPTTGAIQDAEFEQALADVNKQYEKAFRKLAE